MNKQADARELVRMLEAPYSADADAREAILAGLAWPVGVHWVELALRWLEQGAPIDHAIAGQLEVLSNDRNFDQRLRQRTRVLAARWRRGADDGAG